MKIKFELSTAHFAEGMKPSHGPQQWPWWRLFSIGICRHDIPQPSMGRRMWLYTRWGAGYVGIYLVRRSS